MRANGGAMRRTITTSICLGLALIALGCSEGNNVQSNPIGSRCSSTGDCGTKPYNCNTSAPGGYCQKDCLTDGDCPGDSICPAHECRRKCSSTSECRETEGYACISDGTNLFCDVASGNADGGG
jgi:hypothetical protein